MRALLAPSAPRMTSRISPSARTICWMASSVSCVLLSAGRAAARVSAAARWAVTVQVQPATATKSAPASKAASARASCRVQPDPHSVYSIPTLALTTFLARADLARRPDLPDLADHDQRDRLRRRRRATRPSAAGSLAQGLGAMDGGLLLGAVRHSAPEIGRAHV